MTIETQTIAELKALYEKATPGPWAVGGSNFLGTGVLAAGMDLVKDGPMLACWRGDKIDAEQANANADLVVAMHAALPALLTAASDAERQAEMIAALTGQAKNAEIEIERLRAEVSKLDAVVHALGIEDSEADPAEAIKALQDDLVEARDAPWPEWVTAVLAVIRKRSGYDGYDDASDGVDLPAELDETMSELEREAERQTQEVRADRKVAELQRAADHYKVQADTLRAQLASLALPAPAQAEPVAHDKATCGGVSRCWTCAGEEADAVERRYRDIAAPPPPAGEG